MHPLGSVWSSEQHGRGYSIKVKSLTNGIIADSSDAPFAIQ
jgi:hypothetical protein